MQPQSSRDFQRAAAQRLTAAESLLGRANLDAQYIAGYTIECSLKALILDRTPPAEHGATLQRITAGATWHNAETLFGELKKLGVDKPLDLAKRLRRFPWHPGLRYETGRRPTSETQGFLSTAKQVYDWVKDQLP